MLAQAQGGPPLLTDDPGTPGNRNWEINSAYTVESRSGDSESEAPILDINYGWGDRIQLKFELPWVVQKEDGELRSGLGNSLLGVKWRFLDDDTHGLEISTYPQLELNNPVHSVERELVDRGPGFLLPIEIAKKAGPLDLDGEGGYWFERPCTRRWIAGLVAARNVNSRLELLTEVYSIGSDDGRDNTWDFGGRLSLFRPVTLLFMAGRSFDPDAGRQPQFIGYFGLQFVLSSK